MGFTCVVGVLIVETFPVEVRKCWLRDWGKRKENSKFKELFGARISTDVARMLEQKVINVSSTGRDDMSGILILLPVASKKPTTVKLEIRKKER